MANFSDLAVSQASKELYRLCGFSQRHLFKDQHGIVDESDNICQNEGNEHTPGLLRGQEFERFGQRPFPSSKFPFEQNIFKQNKNSPNRNVQAVEFMPKVGVEPTRA
ncbi:hypothetical protein [Candidatus Leptofilum sp.]|uniref:hypothetical protein n=1 Tax=Candidatus Leptofilum sp. TaxID=3241576 RepID=UPI003B5A14D7